MFILFGWGYQKEDYLGPIFNLQCSHCNNEGGWRLYKRSTWFTLFFIPIIPYDRKNILCCSTCSWGFVLSDEKTREMRPLAELNLAFVAGHITEDEYRRRDGLLTVEGRRLVLLPAHDEGVAEKEEGGEVTEGVDFESFQFQQWRQRLATAPDVLRLEASKADLVDLYNQRQIDFAAFHIILETYVQRKAQLTGQPMKDIWDSVVSKNG